MLYSKSHQNLLIGTRNGYLTLLDVPSEKISEEENDQENEEEEKQITLHNKLRVLGSFHTQQINDLKPLGRTTQMVSCSSDCTIAIWEVTTMEQLAVINLPVEPKVLAVNQEGSVTFRCYNICDRKRPKLIH